MLKILRNKELKRKVIWFVAVIIIISFGIFGTAYTLSGVDNDKYAGKIFGKKIDIQKFGKAYQIVEIQSIMRYGESFAKVREFLNLEAQTWDRLILLHEADRRKIKIFNDQVVKTIEENEYFQRNGQFDSIAYNEVLQYIFKIKPRDFEESIRENLQLAYLFDQETQGLTVTPDEVQSEFKRLNEEVQVSYVLISPDQYKDEKMYDETAAKQYFEEHKQAFQVSSAVNVDYIEIPIKQDEKSAAEKKEDESTVESPEKEKASELAQTIFDELLENPDLSTIAKTHSLSVKQTGNFNSDTPNLNLGWSFEVMNQVFKMKLNDIQGPFETANSFIILKVAEKHDAYIPEYETVKDKVKDSYLREQAKEITKNKTEEFRKKIIEQLNRSEIRDFSKTVKELGLDLQETPNFNRGQYLPNIGIVKDFENAAFSLDEKNDVSAVVETPKGYAILHLDHYSPASQDLFAEQKEQLEQTILSERKNEKFKEYMTRVRLEANITTTQDEKTDIL
ncbi:MAG: peptidyl-prolyl cis-trans isomerase [Candidatus Omnitrophica bacterium]|nr:peptidyl-prolyl cis-trans isomerase [Candidatus Omnitrophota bacterium]